MTELVISYQSGNVSYDAISGRLSLYVYDFPRRVRHWDQDRCSDFFEFVYPRIKKMADTFVFNGYPFEAYANISLRHLMNSFVHRKKMEELKETLFYQLCAAGSMGEDSFYKIHDNFNYEVHKPVPVYNKKLGQQRTRRRLFFLALSDPDSLDDSSIEQLASVTGYDAEYISRCCLAVKERIREKRDIVRRLKEKKNGYYFQVLVLQETIMEEPDKEKRIWLSERIRKLRLRIERLSKQIEIKTSCLVTHQDLAQVLGVSKGTVDSSIFYLQRKCFRHNLGIISVDRQSLRSLRQ